MNRVHLLLTMPWVASAKYSRLLAVLFVGGALIFAAVLAVIGGAHAHRAAFILVVCAVWALWSSYLAANIQLARNARDLCLPRIPHDADLSLLLFAALSVVVPTAVCWMLGAAPLLAAAVFTVAAALGLAYMLLPLWIGVPLVMAMVLGMMTHGLAGHVSEWWGLAAVLAGFDVFRWWQLRTATAVRREGMRAAAVFCAYRPDAMRNGGWRSVTNMFLQDGVAPRYMDLKDLGPRRSVSSLRFALGGFGMPKPFASRLLDIARLLAFVGVFALIALWGPLLDSSTPTGRSQQIVLHWLSPVLTFVALLTSSVAVNVFAGRARLLWRKTDAELPLLALLPGLGGTAPGKRSTVMALLAPPAVFLACTCTLLCIAAVVLHTTPWAYLSLVLCCAGALVLIVAVVLASLCGGPMHIVEYVLLYAAQLVLSALVLIKAMPTDQYHGPHPELIGVVPAWLLVLWGLYLIVLAILAMHGARALRKRPHAFLANTP
jgi:hypothetical protein